LTVIKILHNHKYLHMKALIIFLLLSVPGLLFSQNDDSVETIITSVTESIHLISIPGGGNVGVLTGEDGILIIDTHRKQFTDLLQNAISDISNKPVNYVINTHWHYDHVEGNEAFGQGGSLIISHENCRNRLSEDQVIPIFMPHQQSTSPDGLPKLIFSDSITLYLNNEIVHLSHFDNVHTNSDVIIHFKSSNVFHLGDIFVRYGIPFIDVPNGGDINGMISTCERIISITDENSIIIPGHGPISNRNDLINYVEMLTTIRDRISNGIQNGNSLEQIIESNPANEYNSIVEKDNLLELYYYSLKKNY